jgi:hypothetical protein
MCCNDVCGTNQCQYRDQNGERCKKPCRDNPRNVMCVHHAKCLCCSRDAKNGVMCCGDVCGTNQCQYRNQNGERCKKPCRDNPRNVMCIHHAG